MAPEGSFISQTSRYPKVQIRSLGLGKGGRAHKQLTAYVGWLLGFGREKWVLEQKWVVQSGCLGMCAWGRRFLFRGIPGVCEASTVQPPCSIDVTIYILAGCQFVWFQQDKQERAGSLRAKKVMQTSLCILPWTRAVSARLQGRIHLPDVCQTAGCCPAK